eukprot:m.231663 g.231663  ORF g.231663 m.231663 type:complete len:386 (-) comp18438_c0_seq1:23-1180(-)
MSDCEDQSQAAVASEATGAFLSMSTEQLESQLKALQEGNTILKCELDMLDQYLAKSAAKSYQEDVEGEEVAGPTNRRRRSRQQRGGQRVVEQLQLTMQQKCDVAASALDAMKLNADKAKHAHAEELCTIRAELDEIALRETELRKLEYDFTREIVNGPKHPGGAVLAEAVERHFADRHEQRDALIELLQRKDDRLRVARARAQQQMQQREEMGEALHEVDFRQLEIENAQLVDRTKARNTEMLRLKLSAGSLLQVLNDHNKQLQRLRTAGASVRDEIKGRSALLARLASEAADVEQQRAAVQDTNTKLRKLVDGFKVAPVMDYIREAAARQALQQDAATLQRKIDVAQGELRRLQRGKTTSAPPGAGTVAFGSTITTSTARHRWG